MSAQPSAVRRPPSETPQAVYMQALLDRARTLLQIAVGDFIGCELRPLVVGFVTAVAAHRLGARGTFTAFTIDLAGGGTGTVYEPNARLISPDDAHWQQVLVDAAVSLAGAGIYPPEGVPQS